VYEKLDEGRAVDVIYLDFARYISFQSKYILLLFITKD